MYPKTETHYTFCLNFKDFFLPSFTNQLQTREDAVVGEFATTFLIQEL